LLIFVKNGKLTEILEHPFGAFFGSDKSTWQFLGVYFFRAYTLVLHRVVHVGHDLSNGAHSGVISGSEILLCEATQVVQ
jgi:hypothetical protein